MFGPDTVTVRSRETPQPMSFALAELERFEVNRGKPRSLMYGAPIVGAVLGGWFGATALAPDASCAGGASSDPECHWETSAVVVGAGAGAVLFGIAASLLVPEVWRDLPLRALRVAHGGRRPPLFALGLAAPFSLAHDAPQPRE